jgi:hypothetical protein
MHRAHDPEAETRDYLEVPLGQKTLHRTYAAMFSVRPVRRGSRAYMGGVPGCQT